MGVPKLDSIRGGKLPKQVGGQTQGSRIEQLIRQPGAPFVEMHTAGASAGKTVSKRVDRAMIMIQIALSGSDAERRHMADLWKTLDAGQREAILKELVTSSPAARRTDGGGGQKKDAGLSLDVQAAVEMLAGKERSAGRTAALEASDPNANRFEDIAPRNNQPAPPGEVEAQPRMARPEPLKGYEPKKLGLKDPSDKGGNATSSLSDKPALIAPPSKALVIEGPKGKSLERVTASEGGSVRGDDFPAIKKGEKYEATSDEHAQAWHEAMLTVFKTEEGIQKAIKQAKGIDSPNPEVRKLAKQAQKRIDMARTMADEVSPVSRKPFPLGDTKAGVQMVDPRTMQASFDQDIKDIAFGKQTKPGFYVAKSGARDQLASLWEMLQAGMKGKTRKAGPQSSFASAEDYAHALIRNATQDMFEFPQVAPSDVEHALGILKQKGRLNTDYTAGGAQKILHEERPDLGQTPGKRTELREAAAERLAKAIRERYGDNWGKNYVQTPITEVTLAPESRLPDEPQGTSQDLAAVPNVSGDGNTRGKALTPEELAAGPKADRSDRLDRLNTAVAEGDKLSDSQERIRKQLDLDVFYDEANPNTKDRVDPTTSPVNDTNTFSMETQPKTLSTRQATQDISKASESRAGRTFDPAGWNGTPEELEASFQNWKELMTSERRAIELGLPAGPDGKVIRPTVVQQEDGTWFSPLPKKVKEAPETVASAAKRSKVREQGNQPGGQNQAAIDQREITANELSPFIEGLSIEQTTPTARALREVSERIEGTQEGSLEHTTLLFMQKRLQIQLRGAQSLDSLSGVVTARKQGITQDETRWLETSSHYSGQTARDIDKAIAQGVPVDPRLLASAETISATNSTMLGGSLDFGPQWVELVQKPIQEALARYQNRTASPAPAPTPDISPDPDVIDNMDSAPAVELGPVDAPAELPAKITDADSFELGQTDGGIEDVVDAEVPVKTEPIDNALPDNVSDNLDASATELGDPSVDVVDADAVEAARLAELDARWAQSTSNPGNRGIRDDGLPAPTIEELNADLAARAAEQRQRSAAAAGSRSAARQAGPAPLPSGQQALPPAGLPPPPNTPALPTTPDRGWLYRNTLGRLPTARQAAVYGGGLGALYGANQMRSAYYNGQPIATWPDEQPEGGGGEVMQDTYNPARVSLDPGVERVRRMLHMIQQRHGQGEVNYNTQNAGNYLR